MVRMLLLVVVCIGLLPIQMRAQKNSYIIPGEVWKDTDGNPINAAWRGTSLPRRYLLLVWRI